MFEKLDADGDGTISDSEFLARTNDRFAKLDQDNNGTLDKSEMPMRKDRMKKTSRHKHQHDEDNAHKSTNTES